MKHIESLDVKYHQEKVGTLSLSTDGKVCTFEYDNQWLVKFRHTYDPQDMGKQEYHYNEIAKQCGIQVPDFKLVNNKYFACRRFDISPTGERIHVATAGALLNVSLSNPILDLSLIHI